jgi:hypothetical protein
MRRSGLSDPTWQSSLLARLLTPVLAAALLAAAVDLHSALHQRERAIAASHCHHPKPAHLDDGSASVTCLACLFGLKNHSRAAQPSGAITQLLARGRLAAVADVNGVSELSYGLPLSRAPPLS